MSAHEEKMLLMLLDKVRNKRLSEAVEMLWNEGLISPTALERLYINTEVERCVRAGKAKVQAIQQVAEKIPCSFEKARAAVYNKHF